MSASQGILGLGTTLASCATLGGTYTTIVEVFDSVSPDPTPDEVEMTHYLSPNKYKEFLAGFIDGGEVPFELNFTKAQQTALEALRGVAMFWKLTLADGSTYVWPGWLKKLQCKAPLKDKVSASSTVRVTGQPTFTAGT